MMLFLSHKKQEASYALFRGAVQALFFTVLKEACAFYKKTSFTEKEQKGTM